MKSLFDFYLPVIKDCHTHKGTTGERLTGYLFQRLRLPVWASADAIWDRAEAHAHLRSFILLHQETGRPEYLEAALRSASFLKTLTYSYRTPLPEGSTLNREEFNTMGAIASELDSGVLDPYPASIAVDMLHLWKATGDDSWCDVAKLMLNFTYRVLSNEKDRSSGGFLETRRGESFVVCSRHESPRTWGEAGGDAAWVPALITGSLLDINEKFPELIGLDTQKLGVSYPRTGSISRLMRYTGSYINFLRL